METLKTIAVGQGRWRWTEDGYVEKGPFPPLRTSVSVSERDYKEPTGTATIEVIARNAGPHSRVHYSSEPNVSADSPVIPDTIFETDETALHFLAVDPDGQHETGEVAPWRNRLTLTHQPRILPGKWIVELTVKPRGTIRWTTTGANPKHGTVYDGPIEIPSEAEVTIFAYAEDKGVSTSRNFLIPRAEQGSFAIDPTKPAHLRKKLHYRGNNEVFAALNTVKGLQVRLGNVSVEIGEGARNVITRFGSEIVIAPEDLEQFIATARRAISDDTAEVKLGFGDLRFSSGHDLETFLAKLGVEIGAGEVDQ